ncbi:hypothetical protein AAFF_G00074980 [Aldrovandia affinis]|uniref:Peroxisomal ATPase PEX6 n=1 Tax=Aldrovandia affinis TaxID=143900 RepID=A0AAD7RY78_9TELE|nr:hypothetical protein AAFF_G00074980 [Aldrovandia affinis]
MAARVVLSCLDTFPSQLNPLHVLVSRDQFGHWFQSSGEPTCVFLLSARRRQCPPRPDILLCAHLATEEETLESALVANHNTPLKLYTGKSFHRHYGFPPDTEGTVRLVSPVALTKVVIGSRSRQSFKWASCDKFSSGLLILASCQKQTLLARQGDVLLVPYHPLFGDDIAQVHQHLFDLVALECAPVTQGVITADTSVTVTDCRDLVAQTPGALELPHAAHASRTLTSLFASDFAHYANSLDGGSLLDNKRLLNTGFSAFLRALECRIDVRVVDVSSLARQGRIKPKEESSGECGTDVDGSVFVSKNLLLKLGLFNREWVVASAIGDKARSSGRGGEVAQSPPGADDRAAVAKGRGCAHLARVVVADFAKSPDWDPQDCVGYVSPVLWFNLANGEPVPLAQRVVKIKRWIEPLPCPATQLSESRSRTASPPFAKELHIETIVSPDYNSHGVFDSILTEHFSTPRLVQQGDVVCVPTHGLAQFLESNAEGFSRWPVLCFKVKKVCGVSEENGGSGPAGFLVDTRHTSLYTVGSTNSFAPYCCLDDAPSFWTSLTPPGLSNTVEQLTSAIQPYLMSGGCPALSGVCSVLLSGPSGSGKVTALRATCRRLHLHLLKVDCVTVCADTAAACEVKLRALFSRAELHTPCVLLLRNLQLLGLQPGGAAQDPRVLSALCQLIASAPSSVAVVATLCNPRELSPDVTGAFVHQVAMESQAEEQRRAMLLSLASRLPLGKDVNLGRLAKQTAGFVLGDLCALLTLAGKAAHKRLLNLCFPGGPSLQEERDLRAFGVSVQAEDFASALERLQETHAHAIGAPRQVKKEILDTVQLPLDHPELLSLGLRRSGLLLYGPPGTGKTLLAKAVATECAMTFLSVKGPELINMYVGQSEENVREVFSKARAASPCIIFFDELDSLAPNRGRSGDSGGVMDRVVSQLLAELDGLHSSGDVFVIGATNRPDLLDQSLLRPGRFDKLVYVGITEDKESQLQVLKAIVRKFEVDQSVSLQDVVDRCPPQLTGADLYALCSDAMTAAIKRKIALVSEGLDTEGSPLTLTAEDFGQALERLRPSVSDQDLAKYKLIQQNLTYTIAIFTAYVAFATFVRFILFLRMRVTCGRFNPAISSRSLGRDLGRESRHKLAKERKGDPGKTQWASSISEEVDNCRPLGIRLSRGVDGLASAGSEEANHSCAQRNVCDGFPPPSLGRKANCRPDDTPDQSQLWRDRESNPGRRRSVEPNLQVCALQKPTYGHVTTAGLSDWCPSRRSNVFSVTALTRPLIVTQYYRATLMRSERPVGFPPPSLGRTANRRPGGTPGQCRLWRDGESNAVDSNPRDCLTSSSTEPEPEPGSLDTGSALAAPAGRRSRHIAVLLRSVNPAAKSGHACPETALESSQKPAWGYLRLVPVVESMLLARTGLEGSLTLLGSVPVPR